MSWTGEMAAALPDSGGAAAPAATPSAEAATTPDTRAQDHGWAPKVAYDYDAYAITSKDLADAQTAFTGEEPQLAVGGQLPGKMAFDVCIRSLIDPSPLLTF